jgi:hypothetical protein
MVTRHLAQAPAPRDPWSICGEHATAWRWRHSASAGGPGVVWDSVDCISLLFERTARFISSLLRRTIARFELPRTRRWEGRLVRRFGRVLATSAEDAAALEAQARPDAGPQASVTEIENGVDLTSTHLWTTAGSGPDLDNGR